MQANNSHESPLASLSRYELHITRKQNWADIDGPVISFDEWQAYVATDAELQPDPDHPGGKYVLFHALNRAWPIRWTRTGEIRASLPHAVVVNKLLQVADELDAMVVGDRNEVYVADPSAEVGYRVESAESPDVAPVELGEAIKGYGAGWPNYIAAWIFVALFLGGAVVTTYLPIKGVIAAKGDLPFYREKGWCWVAVILMVFVVALFLFLAYFMLTVARSMKLNRIVLHENGLRLTQEGTTRDMAWKSIAAVVETHLYERPPLLKGPAKLLLPKLMSKSYEVKFWDLTNTSFNGTMLQGHLELAAQLQSVLEPLDIPWHIVEEHG